MDFGELEGPYLKPYHYNGRYLDKLYGIRRENNGRFMICDSTLSGDDTSDICIKGRHFKGTHGLWELLCLKNVNRGVVKTDDLKSIKLPNSWPMLISRYTKPKVKCRHRFNPRSETLFHRSLLRRDGLTEMRYLYGNTGRCTDMAGKLYFDSKSPNCFSTLKRRLNWEPGLRHRKLTWMDPKVSGIVPPSAQQLC